MQQRAKFGISLSTVHLLYANPSKDLSEKDYYPGGMVMPERSFAFDFYRFGAASGQEKDNDISGIGNSYTAEYWQYDSRLSRRWNIDPAFAQKPWMSSYHSFSNKFISNIDPNGANDGH